MNQPVIYHIDANFLLNYLIPDNNDIHKAVRAKLDRDNWSNDLYRISKYALGETLKRIMTFQYNNKITWDSVTRRMETIRGLIDMKKISIFDLEDINDEWEEHLKKLMKNKDPYVEKADIFILSFFCADPEANAFYTVDSRIIKSKDINNYLKSIKKRIEEV